MKPFFRSKNKLFCLSVALIVFVISTFFYPFYINGDQEHYRLFYKNVVDYDIAKAYALYFSSLGAMEPVYFLIVYSFSELMPKDILFSVVNGVVFFSFSLLMVNFRVSKLIIITFIFNFYFLVIFFAAERLKIGVLFFFTALLHVNNLKYLLLSVSMVSHLQMIISITIFFLKEISSDARKILNGILTKRILLIFLLSVLLVGMSIPLMGQITHKLMFYISRSDGVFELVKPLLFFLITIPYAKNKYFELSLISVVIFMSVFFVGSDRLVMFSYAVFLYYALQYRRGLNLGVMLTTFYFSVKSVIFVENVLLCGEAFSCLG